METFFLHFRAVFLNNPEDIREVFSKPEFAGRSGFNDLLDKQVHDANYGASSVKLEARLFFISPNSCIIMIVVF